MAVLNASLATALGRPDLAFNTMPAQTAVPPLTSTSPGNDISSTFSVSSRGPGMALLLLVAALGGFIYWVRPHLA